MEKPFVCTIKGCGQSYTRLYSYKMHTRAHQQLGAHPEWKNLSDAILRAPYEPEVAARMLPDVIRGAGRPL